MTANGIHIKPLLLGILVAIIIVWVIKLAVDDEKRFDNLINDSKKVNKELERFSR